jgi:hypothetical protein
MREKTILIKHSYFVWEVIRCIHADFLLLFRVQIQDAQEQEQFLADHKHLKRVALLTEKAKIKV